ncbi:MAG: hypothetical protein ACRCZI_09800 [Cetobacterium sp.]
MNVVYRIKMNGTWLRTTGEFSSPTAAWYHVIDRKLPKAEHKAAIERLKQAGYSVERKIHTDSGDGDIAEAVAAEVIGPKKAGFVRGILGAIFGKKN